MPISSATASIPTTAVLYSAGEGAVAVMVGERSVRAPGPGEVRVKVAAAAVNPTDILLREIMAAGNDQHVTPGMDLSGIVEAVGPDVHRLKVGDEVMAAVVPGRPDGGAQAQYVVLPAASVVTKPGNVTLLEAATLPMNGLTAFYALDLSGLSEGQVLAVSGGAGVLGSYMIGVAKAHGLTVVADAKRAEFEKVKQHGADIVVERGANFAEAVRQHFPQGVDALLDTALLEEAAWPAIKDGGVYIPVRSGIRTADVRDIATRLVLVPDVIERTDWLEAIRALVEAGKIIPQIAGTYGPEDVMSAQGAIAAGGLRGRPLIVF